MLMEKEIVGFIEKIAQTISEVPENEYAFVINSLNPRYQDILKKYNDLFQNKINFFKNQKLNVKNEIFINEKGRNINNKDIFEENKKRKSKFDLIHGSSVKDENKKFMEVSPGMTSSIINIKKTKKIEFQFPLEINETNKLIQIYILKENLDTDKIGKIKDFEDFYKNSELYLS